MAFPSQHQTPDSNATLLDLFETAVGKEKPDLLNYKQDGSWRHISSHSVAEQVRNAAIGLMTLGVSDGSHVGILSENRPEWTIADFAVLSIGAADVPVYATQAPRQIAFILADAQVEVLFVSGTQYRRVRDVLAGSHQVAAIVVFDEVDTKDERVLSFNELQRRGKSADHAEVEEYRRARSALVPDHLATLIYTSGTTGEPKGVMLSHGNLVSNAISNRSALPLEPEDVVLSYLPLSHVFERMVFYIALYQRATIYYAESVDAVALNMREVRPHYMTSVPRLFEKMYAFAMKRAHDAGPLQDRIARWAVDVARRWATIKNGGGNPGPWLGLERAVASRLVFSKWRAAVGGRIRRFVSGGAALSPEIAHVFYGAGLPILQGYGMTESSPVITANTREANRLGSVGRPIAGVEVKIAPDGEILCSGPNVMKGYYRRPEDTAETLVNEDGKVWLHTGDIGHIDGDGFLFITDRKKDLIKTSGGKYIAPQPIEALILKSRYVDQAVVIGDQRKFPAALIAPRLEALESFAKSHGIKYGETKELLGNPEVIKLFEHEVADRTKDLSHFEQIKAIGLLERELTIDGGELTPTLKVRRRVVAEKYKDLIDRIYAEKEGQYAASR
jgi:long-chain acyl-CoA synthetase